jgi:NitT/TauT family transport system ATP-binding protein
MDANANDKPKDPAPDVVTHGSPAAESVKAPAAKDAAAVNPRELVAFDKVTKKFGSGPDAKVAIQEVTFCVEDLPGKGELITVVGPSGCGKSTVLRIIAGLGPHFPPTSGSARIFGKPVELPGPDRGLVDQKYSLLPHLTVIENVAFGLKLKGEPRDRRFALAREWITKVGLEGSEGKYPSELSGGMQQRVAIAATLILKPRILLMDEPFGALDPRIRLRMQELLIQLWREQESTVFLVTHSVEEAVYLGDRVFLMGAKPGRLVEILQVPRPEGPPEQARRQRWFMDFSQELLRRLEEEEPVAIGAKA